MTADPGPELALVELAELRAGSRPLSEMLSTIAQWALNVVPNAAGASVTVHAPARFIAGSAGSADGLDPDDPASEENVRVALALPLRAGEQVIGAMNIYSRTDGATIGEEGVWLAEMLAAAAATVVGNAIQRPNDADLCSQLRSALRDREVVERATGLLMARYDYSASDASVLLLHAANERGTTAAELAVLLLARTERDPVGADSRGQLDPFAAGDLALS